MAADVPAFVAALDKVYGNFSTFDMQPEPGSARGAAAPQLEQRLREQLQRARAAFLQEFRNHSVVVECEVRKIREELTRTLEEKYGERIEQLKRKNLESEALIQKLRDEVAHLKGLVTAQESYLVSVRHQRAQVEPERLTGEIDELRQQLEDAAEEKAGLSNQLSSRNELVTQLGGELSKLEAELKRQVSDFAREKRSHDDVLRALKDEMKQQRQQFESRMTSFQEQFEEYKAKTTAELQVQEILNARRAEALRNMEDERQRHVKARTKPTARISALAPIANPMLGSAPPSGIAPVANPLLGSGPPGAELTSLPNGDADEESEARYEQYMLAKDTRYRVDDMGMDTAWRDYQLSQPAPSTLPARKAMPKFRVERARKANSVGPHAPVATEDALRPEHSVRPVPLRQLELPAPHTAR
mmetsp:Transcript_58342/g.157292  ORF Transcript_58342/g.157292 Transcript_58342/m.157292 type:complete len:416 (+) Transcript_58342:66-1313(+)